MLDKTDLGKYTIQMYRVSNIKKKYTINLIKSNKILALKLMRKLDIKVWIMREKSWSHRELMNILPISMGKDGYPL